MAVIDAVTKKLPTSSTKSHFFASDSALAATVAANWAPIIRKAVSSAEVYAAKADGPFSIGNDGGIGQIVGKAGDVIVYDPATQRFSKVSAADLETLYEANDVPVVTMTGAALEYTRNAAATAVDSGLTVTDADTTNLTGATVAITTAYDQGDDVLAVATANGISGTFNAATGVLTLTGTASVANYQDRLRAVTFFSATGASTTGRVVTVQVTDSQGAVSVPKTRSITVS